MARSVNDRLQDETIAHGLYVTRYGNGVARRMVALLNKLDVDLAARLLVLLDGKRADTYSARRLASLLAGVRELNQQAYEPVIRHHLPDCTVSPVPPGALRGGAGLGCRRYREPPFRHHHGLTTGASAPFFSGGPMAGLTKEQRAQREAEKLAAQNSAEQNPAQQDQQGVELVVMVRDIPEFPGGPLSAEVHPDEVDNWLALDWRLEA